MFSTYGEHQTTSQQSTIRSSRPSSLPRRIVAVALAVAGLLLAWWALELIADASSAAEPAYGPSPVIDGVRFNRSTLRLKAPGSDNWPVTWAADNKLYTTWGDGGGFGGNNVKGRVSLGVGVVTGGKRNYRGRNIAGGHNATHNAPFDGKSLGMLAIGNRLYMWRSGDDSETSAFDFSQLWRSDDYGASWEFTGVEFSRHNDDFQEDDFGFFSPTFAQKGRGYADDEDGYVYTYAPEIIDPSHWDMQQPGRVTLLRVATEDIERKEAYQYFAGRSWEDEDQSSARWSSAAADRQPVWEHSEGGVHRLAVSYNKGLDRYLLTTMGPDRSGWIAIYDAPRPWGPWTTVLLEKNRNLWGSKTVSFHFVNKWTSADGRNFVLVYTRNDQWASIEGTFLVTAHGD